MSRPHPEPLSPEERALADRLARLGPHDGPPPALDAKILAAAHAAVAPPRRRRRHWLGLSAIPGGLITGTGMAAALALVIGSVWQLRPSDPAPRPVLDEGEMAPVEAQIIARPRQVIAPPPPPVEAPEPTQALSAPAMDHSAAIARPKAAPAETAAAAAAAPEAETERAPARVATVGPDEAIHFDTRVPAAPAAEGYADDRPRVAAAPATPAPASATPEAVDAQSDAARKQAFGLMRARQQESIDEQTMAASKQAADRAEASTTLDRIEVTGSRIKDGSGGLASDAATALADIPVADDARLDRKAWLERIRARRDAGDAERARESLALFRKAHPRASLPQDLRELTAPPR